MPPTDLSLHSSKILTIQQSITRGVSSVGKPCRPEHGFPRPNCPGIPPPLSGTRSPQRVSPKWRINRAWLVVKTEIWKSVACPLPMYFFRQSLLLWSQNYTRKKTVGYIMLESDSFHAHLIPRYKICHFSCNTLGDWIWGIRSSSEIRSPGSPRQACWIAH